MFHPDFCRDGQFSSSYVFLQFFPFDRIIIFAVELVQGYCIKTLFLNLLAILIHIFMGSNGDPGSVGFNLSQFISLYIAIHITADWKVYQVAIIDMGWAVVSNNRLEVCSLGIN